MSYNGKCMHCIKIETGSLIFAILSVIVTGVGILFTTGMLVYVNVVISDTVQALTKPEDMEFGLTANVILGIILCLLLVPFAFTIVLLKGLVQKKALYVKVYYLYAVMCTFLLMVGAVVGIVSGSFDVKTAFNLIPICVLFALFLRMIYLTYKKLEVAEQHDTYKLVEYMH